MNYLTQRLLTFPLVLLGVSLLVFFAIRLVPGDAIIAMLGTEAGLLTEAQRASLEAYFGIDQPVIIQYGRWLAGLFEGNFGIEWKLSPDEKRWAIRYSTSTQPWDLYIADNKPGAVMSRVTKTATPAYEQLPVKAPEVIQVPIGG